MCSPSEDAYDMTGVALDRSERSVECGPADGVKDDVEPLSGGASGDIFFYRDCFVVDGSSIKVFHDTFLVRGNSGENFCAEGVRKLNRNLTDATGSRMDQHFVASANLSPVQKSFPRRYRA